MSEHLIPHLFQSLEQAIHERLSAIQDVLTATRSQNYTSFPGMNTTYAAPLPDFSMLLQKIQQLEVSNRDLAAMLQTTRADVAALRESRQDSLLPLHPMEGIEVIPKREVVIPDTEPLSFADRLLLNKTARKALEAEEMGEVWKPLEEVEAEEEEEEVEEEVEEETEEAEEPEPEAEELEEFEYRGSTYYRDSDKNVFMTDEDGELVEQPIGTWNEAKQRILMMKSDKI